MASGRLKMHKLLAPLLGLTIALGLAAASPARDIVDSDRPAAAGPQGTSLPDNDDRSDVRETSGPITLAQALRLALSRNPELEAFALEARASEARALQAGLLPNPELEFEVEEFGGRGELSGFGGAATTIRLSQLVLLGGKRDKAVRAARSERELAGWGYEAKRLDTLAETTLSFIGVLEAQSRLELAGECLELSREVYSAVSAKVEAGKVSPIEETKAGIALSNSEIELERARRNLEAARRGLAASWGSTVPVFARAEGDLADIEEPPPLDDLLGRAEENPDLARWRTELELGRAALDSAGALAVPDLAVFAGVQSFNETDDSAYIAGISAPLPIFDRNQGGIMEARHNLTKSERERAADRVRVETALAQEYQGLAASYREAVKLRDEALPDSRLVFASVGEGYRLGKFDYLDVLDAQRTLFETESRYIAALAEYQRARTMIERLTGMELGPKAGPAEREGEQ